MIKKHLSILTIIALFFISTIANGADWVKVEESDTSIFYVDSNSIKQVAHNQYQAWYKNQVKKDRPYKEVRTYGLYDCVGSKFKVLQSVFYNKDGSSNSSSEEDWEFIVPESMFETVFNFVCTYKKGVIKIPKREHE